MHSGMIGKIDKAHRYAAERDRFHFEDLTVTIHGNNDDHAVSLHDGEWRCECDFFAHVLSQLIDEGVFWHRTDLCRPPGELNCRTTDA